MGLSLAVKTDLNAPPHALPRIDPLEPTIFHEPWWLDITTAGQCRFAEVVEHGKTVARLPYMLTRKHGVSIVDMPPLTHFLGPAMIGGEGKDNNRFLRRLDLTRLLIAQLPATSSFYIKCHRDITDVISFQDCGFRSAVQFTHEILPQPIDAVWQGMRDKGRNGIRLARNFVTLDRGLSGSDFTAFYNANIHGRGRTNNLDMAMAGTLIDAALARKRGAVWGARDHEGRLASAIFCVWDETAYYYLMSTRAETAHRGVTSLLLWEAVSDAMRRGLIFDFDGVANEGSARLAANFTGTIAPRYVVTRESKAMRIWRALHALRHQPNHFCR